jgi:hypothetical protein
MSGSTVVFSTVSQTDSHHEDWIDIILLLVHALKLGCLCIVSDGLDIIKGRELNVFLTNSVNENWLIDSKLVKFTHPFTN